MAERYSTPFGTFVWHENAFYCDHGADNACPTCDHDGYYRRYVRAQSAKGANRHG